MGAADGSLDKADGRSRRRRLMTRQEPEDWYEVVDESILVGGE
jgi:hypothetical protein